ncbi:MAG: hypothetical protein IKT32_06580 [Clostridia bacterium]|jgi:DNA replication initiation complex subunit (GINS family)|nr:hypothetical protein [Clostridia bacterium]
MSYNDSIAAATEELLNITREYYRDLSNFIEDMNAEVDELNEQMRMINQNWNDANFTQFKNSVDEKVREINDQIDRAKSLLTLVAEAEKGFADALAIING